LKAKPTAIDTENLIMSAVYLDSMSYIIQEMLEDYFEKFDSSDNSDIWRIAYEFNHNRARVETLFLLLRQISDEFKKCNITAYQNNSTATA
jgi:hypothetical protein